MDFSETAHDARYDQVRAAQADVVGILGVIARERQRWSRVDEGTHARIDALLEQIFALDADPARVCPHARQVAFDRAPRPLVLDSVRGILACWEGCYWRTVSSGVTGGPINETCFNCGRRLDRLAGQDLFIAYGPILVVAALCAQCREGAHPGSDLAPETGA
jgi:hypothetical protein